MLPIDDAAYGQQHQQPRKEEPVHRQWALIIVVLIRPAGLVPRGGAMRTSSTHDEATAVDRAIGRPNDLRGRTQLIAHTCISWYIVNPEAVAAPFEIQVFDCGLQRLRWPKDAMVVVAVVATSVADAIAVGRDRAGPTDKLPRHHAQPTRTLLPPRTALPALGLGSRHSRPAAVNVRVNKLSTGPLPRYL